MSESKEISSNALVAINSEYTSTPTSDAKNSSSSISDTDNTDNAPRILCNELIVNPNNSKSLEKLDELSCLEREIAKMHHADETNLDLEDSTIDPVEKDKAQKQDVSTMPSNIDVNDKTNEKNPIKEEVFDIEAKLDAITSGETALEHEDLIAVLKGIDNNAEETPNNSGTGAMLEGVTIEGEGEYQIMEVVDEDSNATEDNTKQSHCVVPTADPVIQSLNKNILTPQEERALALEQMEHLKQSQRRRKQDIKPIKQIDSAIDLVSALEADWSEHDEETEDTQKLETKTKHLSNKTKTVASTVTESKNNTPLITSVVVIPSNTASVSSTPMPASTSPAMSTKKSTDKTASTKSEEKKSSKSPLEGVIETKTEQDTQVVSSHSGFRRTRIIKRKIIWDPDAPETAFSYAQLVKPTNNNSKTKTDPSLPTTSIKKGSTTITPIKKETLTPSSQSSLKKTQRPTTPKAKRAGIDSNTEKTNTVKVEKHNVSLKNATLKETKSNNKTEDQTVQNENECSPTMNSPPKRRSQTPVSNGTGCAKKKKISEVDRLMGDEGAVNMLNSLEKLEATLGSGEVKPTRPMMRSRAATICEKLPPRKETSSPTRSTTNTSPTTTNTPSNKGKRTPKSRASSSWDFVYKKKKQDFDDSLIIRRRSNSSYSSTTSINRLSTDGPPGSAGNNKTNKSSIQRSDSLTSLPASSNDNDSSKKSSSTVNHDRSSGSSKSRSMPTPPSGKSFEFAKPESKKSQKRTKSPAATLTNDMRKAAPVAAKRNVRSPATTSEDKNKDLTKSRTAKSPTNIKDKKDSTPSTITVSDVVVKKSSKVAQILFSTNKAKLSNTFTTQMLNKLIDILDKLASDPDCHVVVIGTNDAHFCQGIDITDLLTIAEEKRKTFAVNLATSAKNYLKTLATYPKPIVGGVNGNLTNFGVIQLALFDVVIAGDKTTFEMPYAKMGQTPEGYCLWHNMNKIRGSFKTKLFWLCEKVQSTEAALAGLVNKLTAANKVNDDALMTAKRIASYSAESYRAMKKTIINSHLDVIVNSMDEEFDTIIKQWTSNECLESLKKYIGKD